MAEIIHQHNPELSNTMKFKHNSKKRSLLISDWMEMGAALLIIIFVNLIGHYFFARIDLTAEHRYTLSDSTKEMLRKIDEPVLFRVYLEGEFPADFKRLQNETKEMLNQFRAYNRY
ncbi:MAG: Gldg family protein, partial [Bacteroidales bacterium]|nr:Gldg family protein [Candidatus Colimorpha onthohippi]